jgi:hypothetical protein
VSRNYDNGTQGRTGIATADTAVPAAPEDTSRSATQPAPAGVYWTDGATMLKVDVVAPATSTGNTTLAVYAWDSGARQWAMEGAALTVPATSTGDFSGRLISRATVLNWCSRWAAVMVTGLATNGGSGVGTAVYVTPAMQSK